MPELKVCRRHSLAARPQRWALGAMRAELLATFEGHVASPSQRGHLPNYRPQVDAPAMIFLDSLACTRSRRHPRRW